MRKENKDDLSRFVAQYTPSAEQEERLVQYIELVEEWSEKTNLVSSSDVTKLVGKHIVESMLFDDKAVLKENQHIVDLGSGAGFPGIPLKIFNPNNHITLVDSRKMKAHFLEEAVASLQLSDTTVLCERIENTGVDKFSGPVDIITARAVANLKKLWSWTRQLFPKNGTLIVIKGGDFEAEIKETQKMFSDFDVKIKDTGYVSATNNALSQIMLIKN